MGILEFAKPVIVICTRDRARAAAFYRETLGLVMTSEDNLAAVFNVGGIALRVSTVADFVPHEHTILGFNVPDVTVTVKALHEKGITFNKYKGFNQDEARHFDRTGHRNARSMVYGPGRQCAERHERVR